MEGKCDRPTNYYVAHSQPIFSIPYCNLMLKYIPRQALLSEAHLQDRKKPAARQRFRRARARHI